MITHRETRETLLCIAYVFEVSTSEHGAQHHIYRLVKDWGAPLTRFLLAGLRREYKEVLLSLSYYSKSHIWRYLGSRVRKSIVPAPKSPLGEHLRSTFWVWDACRSHPLKNRVLALTCDAHDLNCRETPEPRYTKVSSRAEPSKIFFTPVQDSKCWTTPPHWLPFNEWTMKGTKREESLNLATHKDIFPPNLILLRVRKIHFPLQQQPAPDLKLWSMIVQECLNL